MTTPNTDAQQLADNYDVKRSVDKLRDAIYVPGPSMQEHLDSLKLINADVPEFFMTAAFALGAYLNNQPGEVDPATVEALVVLVSEYGHDARESAFEHGADVLGGAVNDLGIALRLDKKLPWIDPTPDAPVAAE